jgi:trk system potassium uptake protein
LLVQLGGLGIMTFTGFFGFYLSGRSSYKTQVMFAELMDEKKLGSVIYLLTRVVMLTFLFELLGAVLIYFSTDTSNFSTRSEHVFFALFHSVSSFCNAGFSTLSAGLFDETTRFNYTLQLIIAALYILGGLGFAIILNIRMYFMRRLNRLIDRFWHKKPVKYKPWILSFNSKIIIYTTVILLVFGFAAFFVLEYDHSLAEHPTFYGKVVTAFFAGSTPRTAGYNTVDMTTLSLPVVLIIMLLMWIGGSPGSTAGGIRTTTIAVATLNIINTGRNSDRMNLFRREISNESIRKAFAIIALSLVWLAIAISGLSFTDGSQSLIALAFESFSAFSTVGLTLGLTSSLSDGGKILIVITMFVGRVGTLTLLVALMKNRRERRYQYPEEQVLF